MQDFYGFFNNGDALLKAFIFVFITTISLVIAKKIFFRWKFVDKPNFRSNHNKPVALGGGIIIIPLIIIFSFLNNYIWNLNILISILILFFISMWDDLKNIKPLPRLFFHFLAVTIYVIFYLYSHIDNDLIDNKNILFILSVFLIFGIVWFINAFNFMDGINGITSVQVISICLSLLALDYYINNEINILAFSVLIITLVFCYFNWTPASIFLGDSGSIPLGFIVFVLLTDYALKGMWIISAILPLYYLMDTSITLIKRVYKRQRFWEAHKEHFYQQAIKKGFSHSSVSLKLLIVNIGLFSLSFYSYIYKNDIIIFIIALVWSSLFMYIFSKNK